MTTSIASKISRKDSGELFVPDHVIIPFIEGDGVGADIWKAAVPVFESALKKAYSSSKAVTWVEVLAGEKAFKKTGNWLPDETLQAIQEHIVAIKGPLTTPVGTGVRSINVALRQLLDLYACVRPVRYYPGVPSPMKCPEKVDMVIFRENTEDVYAGIEFPAKSSKAEELTKVIERLSTKKLHPSSAIGIKPASEFASKRLVQMAIEYAIEKKISSVTLVHKGNIMKFTEGAFRSWGYELAKERFGELTVTEEEVTKINGGQAPSGKVVIKDRIADSMFQQILIRPQEYGVIATTNLNGDYLSDALAAQVGGLGLAPGANIGSGYAVFEATHGTAPKYAGQDKINPGSLILSGKMMFDYLGWREAATLLEKALEQTIGEGIVTYDLARGIEKGKTVREVSCSGFGQAMVERMGY